MEATSFMALDFFIKAFHLLSIITLTLPSVSASVSTSLQWNDSDRLSLLAIKSQIELDPLGALSSWNYSAHHCDWNGITCSRRHLGRVTMLHIRCQKLKGTLSPYIGNLTFLSDIRLDQNNFYSVIPQEIGGLHRLQNLVLSYNSFMGEIPAQLSNCSNLREIYLDNNLFTGGVPYSFQTLRDLNYLDLSNNALNWTVPDYLWELHLLYLNLSFNNLEGSVPTFGVFGNASAFFVVGNMYLCGGIIELHLPVCILPDSPDMSDNQFPYKRRVVILIFFAILSFIALSCTFIMALRKASRRPSFTRSIFGLWYKRTSYGELLEATDGFSDENLIGVGSHGSLYKGIFQQINKTVTVKVMKLQTEGSSKSFLKEYDIMRNIYHRNLLKIITICSSVDFKGNDFKALVFDFVANGSLDSWLHPRVDEQQIASQFLNFIHRLNIAIDVASALDYLHHHCQPHIFQCDVKPSNVLLDDEMTAHVVGFRIAKLCATSSHDSAKRLASSLVIKDSIGYLAPEYGVGGEVSPRGDVYSYGILLLEMFTRKKPTDDMFLNGLCLHDYAEIALRDQVTDIIDPLILREDKSSVEHNRRGGRLQESLVSIIRIAVACSDGSPLNRMHMSQVVDELHHIKEGHQAV